MMEDLEDRNNSAFENSKKGCMESTSASLIPGAVQEHPLLHLMHSCSGANLSNS